MNKGRVAAVVGIGFVGLVIACGRDLVQPTEDLPVDIGASIEGEGTQGGMSSPPPGAGMSGVFEELGLAAQLISGLAEGTCVIHYRRPNGKYTPIPFKLSTGRSLNAARTRPVVYRGWRWDDEIGVRAVCIAPAGSDEIFLAAVAEILERASQPAFARDANGAVRLFDEMGGSQTASAGRNLLHGALAELPGILLKNAQRLLEMVPKFGPKPLYASIGDPCNEDPTPGDDDETCEIDGIDVEGEDPCDDEYGEWDNAWEECVCDNGEEWDSDDDGVLCESDDDVPEPPSDSTSGGGGGSDPDDNEDQAFSLSCTSVERGATATCTISGPSVDIHQVDWRFEGSGFSFSHMSTELSWSGRGVISGQVRAIIDPEVGAVDTVEANLEVDERDTTTGSWNWLSSVSYVQGTAPTDYDGQTLSDLDPYGWVCELELGCPSTQTTPVFYPTAESGEGYTWAQVDSGPNTGILYVVNAFFRMNIGSNLNPHMLSSANETFPLVQGTDDPTPNCPTGTSVTIYHYNTTCQELSLASLTSVAWAHEDRHGTKSVQLAETHNPRGYIEWIWGTNLAIFRDVIEDALDVAERNIGEPSYDFAHDGGKRWCGIVYKWHSSSSEFTASLYHCID